MNNNVVAQACKIRTFKAVGVYADYIQKYIRKKCIKSPSKKGNGNDGNDSNSENKIGENLASILAHGNGWKTLLRLMNDLKYDGKNIQFTPMLNDSEITYKPELRYITFPKVNYTFLDRMAKLSVIINPCVSETVRTKLITRPTFSCTKEELLSSPQKVIDFFEHANSLLDSLFGVIKKFYIEKIKIHLLEDPTLSDDDILESYCNVDIFVLGCKNFNNWIKYCTNKKVEQVNLDIENRGIIKCGRRILETLRRPEAESAYTWFSRSWIKGTKDTVLDNEFTDEYGIDACTDINSLYAVHGEGNNCKVLGIVDNHPGRITGDLSRDLILKIDKLNAH